MEQRRLNSGFSLIEVMVAVAILSIGLVGILGLQTMGIRTLAHARYRTTAAELASMVMETLKTTPVDLNNPGKIFVDSKGNNIVDANNNALLSDGAIGDGQVSWHLLPLMNAEGHYLTTSTPVNERHKYTYLAIYSVEWGKATGSTFIPVQDSVSEYLAAGYPEIRPLLEQIYLEVWVGWIEPLGQTGDPSQKTMAEFFTSVDDTFTKNPAIFPVKKVKLKDIRRI